MKKEIFYYTVLLFIISGLIFIETTSGDDEEVNISKVIDVENFQKLDIDLICNVYVSIGDEQRVVLEGPENYLNAIETKFEDGVLKLTGKSPGILSGLFSNPSKDQQINLYLKLTSVDQLITPTKGTLITNESSLNFLLEQERLSINQHLLEVLKLVGNQTGFIRQALL